MPADETEMTVKGDEVTKSSNVEDGPPQKVHDPVQDSMGPLGKWHYIVCTAVFLLKFPVAWHQMAIIFLGPPVKYECVPASINGTIIPKCADTCVKVYDRSVFTETIITQWDLVCDKEQLANLSQTIFMFGILFGNMFFGTMADKFGRRSTLVIAVIIQLFSGVATAWAPSFVIFCILRFLTAVVTGGTMVTSFVLTMEIIGIEYRELFSVLYQIPFNLGHLTLPLFAYVFRDWHHFQFAISIPSIILLSYYWLVPESPRWLFTVGRVDEAAVILKKAAKQNGLPTENIQSILETAQKAKHENSPVSKGNFFDLFRTPNLRMKTIYMCFNWFVCGLAFFGLAQYIGLAGGDIFANVAISACLELPGTLFCIYSMKRFGRKRTLICSNTLTGVCMLAIAFVHKDNSWAIVILASIGIVGMSISFPTVYLYAGELFPTVVRNIGIGTASMIARIGSMVAPYVAGFAATIHWLPPIIFGVTPLVGAGLVFLLPETRGCSLPETIEDGENFGKKHKSVENGK